MNLKNIWPNVYSGLIILIFLLALAGNEPAKEICLDGSGALAVLLAGAGLRMAKDVAMARAGHKKQGSQDVGGEDL